ncbi:MAG: hypothetical protein ACKOIA_08230 [Acidimicrobiia bacterium]
MPSRSTAAVALVVSALVLALGAVMAVGVLPVGAQTSTTTSTTSTTSSTSSTSSTTTTSTVAPSTTVPQSTTSTQRAPATTQRSTSTTSSSTTTTASTTTTIAPAVVPPGYSDPGAGGSSFWTTGRKIGAVVAMLALLGVAMAVLSYLYWRATRPGADGDGDRRQGPGGGGPSSGPVGPLDPMVADALRTTPPVTLDDLGLT